MVLAERPSKGTRAEDRKLHVSSRLEKKKGQKRLPRYAYGLTSEVNRYNSCTYSASTIAHNCSESTENYI